MLAIPEEVSSCAKLFSPADEPLGTPSSKIWCPEAPSSTPLPPLASSACRSSLQAVSNCAVVLAWPNSYNRANFSRMFKLRTNALAPVCVSGLIPVDRLAPESHCYLCFFILPNPFLIRGFFPLSHRTQGHNLH